jgi:hypothetical protein
VWPNGQQTRVNQLSRSRSVQQDVQERFGGRISIARLQADSRVLVMRMRKESA